METSLFFYDLETSGLNPREDRVMQFAGQRTDMNMVKIGYPFNYLIKLTEDVLPDPQAILVTGITPQQTISKGLTEAAFLNIFHEQIATPDTVFVGYNNVQFDDEFIRYMNYRNFYDPYEWQWQDNRSRWDLINVIRMMRALRPEGVKWPVDPEGRPVNSLEKLATANGLEHLKAHDAQSDVTACIALARLIQQTQPKLFKYLYNLRDKHDIAQQVKSNEPFVYAGSFQGDYDKTSVYYYLYETVSKQEALLYDLRYDPFDLINLNAEQLAELWQERRDYRTNPFPLRTIKYNRCPAIAPLKVLDEASQTKLQLDPTQIRENRKHLEDTLSSWLPTLRQMMTLIDKVDKKRYHGYAASVDSLLYEKFLDNVDKKALAITRSTPSAELKIAKFNYTDRRLRRLLPLYKARNYPESLTATEVRHWHDYCQRHLLQGGDRSRYANFVVKLQSLAEMNDLKTSDQKLLAKLDAWAYQLILTAGL